MTLSFAKMKAAYKAGHLLDLEMPNGRALRDCTADDCFAARDNWLKEVGVKVHNGWSNNPDRTGNRKVSEVYNETTLGWHFFAFHYKGKLQWAGPNPVDPGDEFDGGKFR
jgi:hypothetical protein